MRYLLLAVTAVLVLTGCGGKSEAASPTTTTPSQSPEEAFIAQLEEGVPTYVVEPKRDRLIKVGYDVCQTLDNGRLEDSEIITTVASMEGLEVGQAEALFWAARDNFCPDL